MKQKDIKNMESKKTCIRNQTILNIRQLKSIMKKIKNVKMS